MTQFHHKSLGIFDKWKENRKIFGCFFDLLFDLATQRRQVQHLVFISLRVKWSLIL